MAGRRPSATTALKGLVPDVDLTVQEQYEIRDRLGKGVSKLVRLSQLGAG